MGLFDNAQTIKAEPTKGRKPKSETIPMTGIERHAAIDAAIKSLKALLEVDAAQIKADATVLFLNQGMKTNKKPENFKAKEGSATTSVELRKRSSASALSEDEAALLTKFGVPYTKEVITEEAFLINPKYTHDMALLAKIEEALSTVDLPSDFLMKQEKVEKPVVTDESVDTVFEKTMVEAEILLPLVTTLALKPAIKGDFWSILDAIMNPQEEEEEEEEEEAAGE